jgi:photosystem II stability/assembly factor-like uncharacterized protein
MNRLLLLFFLALANVLSAQKINQEDFKNLNFRNIGPAGMSGRITAIDVNLRNPDIIYVGSASGGVWKSINGGINWKPIFDDQPVLSIGSIKINQSNPSEIWVGTGEGNPRNSVNCGAGIFKSLDGGQTWNRMGLEKTKVIHRIVINPNNSNEVLAAAMGSPWGPHKERGVFKTTDGGKSWKKVLYVNDLTGAADMVMDPNNPNKIIVGMWEHHRQPWFFTSGGEGSGMYITYDGGDNWKRLGTEEGMPKGDLGRMGIAFAASNPDKVYALIEAKENGLYVSNDGGAKWSLVSKKNIGNRPFYYAELYVDPQNENTIYNLHTYVTKSEDGGKSFKTIADYGNNVHPDHHAFWIHPENSDFLIDGNDGGMNISRDAGATWQFVTNLPVGQFYHVNVDNAFPYNVYGGMQDNGSWAGPGFVLKRGGIRNYDWQELYFGDGFDVIPEPTDNRYGYAMSQGGNVGYYDRVTGKNHFIKPIHDDIDIKLRYNWNAAIAVDPHQEGGVYFGSQFVHYTRDRGDSWETISPDLTTNDTTKHKQDISGGLTIDATNAENHTTILCIAPSPADKDVIYVSTDDGNLQVSTDGGKNWSNTSRGMSGLPRGAWIPQIKVSPTNAGEAFVVANDYRRNNWSAYAYHTTNYGKSWNRIVSDASVNSFVTSIIQDPKEENLLFLGTDGGLYISVDKGRNWQHWTEGMPPVQIRDLAFQETFDDLVLGTFGRSFWVLDDVRPLRELASRNDFRKKDFALLESPDAYLTSFRSYDGIRFIGQAEFVGDNKRNNGSINYWVKPKEKESANSSASAKSNIKGKGKKKKGKKSKKKESKNKADKDKMKGEKGDKKKSKKSKDIMVSVLNAQRDTVRYFTSKAKEGLNSLRWGLNIDGVEYPSRRDREDDDRTKPGGYRVMPGDYLVVAVYKGKKDSTMVTVKADPRLEVSDRDMADIQKTFDDYYSYVTESTEAFAKIKEAKKSLDIVKKLIPIAEKADQDSLKAKNKIISKRLTELEELYMDSPGKKGIQRNSYNLNSYLFTASRYVGSSLKKPGKNAMLAVNHAKTKVEEVTSEVESFFEKDWPEYKRFVNDLNLTPFKEE